MGDRVRVILSYDPLGIVQDYLDRMEAFALTQSLPRTGDSFILNLIYHAEYDGIYACYKMAKLLATQNPTLSTALYDNAELMCESIHDNYANADAGPTEDAEVAPGAATYNLGPRMLALDAATDPAIAVKAGRLAANYARGSAWSGGFPPTAGAMYSAARWFVYGDDTWPSSTTGTDPANPPEAARMWALAVLSHLIADSDFSTYEARSYDGVAYTDSHAWCMSRLIKRWFLGIPEASGALHQWAAIQADLVAADGDWSQVPGTWTESTGFTSYGFSSFEFYHTARALIYYYEDDFDDSVNAEIQQAVTDMCDWMLLYWQKDTVGGRDGIMYRVKATAPHAPTVGAANLANMSMPMFAWAYAKTGQAKYYDMAAGLARTGSTEPYLTWGKHFNENVIWVYDGFQWLGWTRDPFTVFWK